MPLCYTRLLRRIGLTLGAAFWITSIWALPTLHAQSSFSSSSVTPSSETSSLEQPLPIAELPDAPSAFQDPQGPQSSQSAQTPKAPSQQATDPDIVSPNGTKQTKRVLGIVPNFSSVSADTKLPPQTAKEKLTLAAKNSFDYSSFIVAGIQAGISMNSKSYPEFHQGAAGYARYFWHTEADTADENFMVGGLGPIAFHQDSRFYTLGHGGFPQTYLVCRHPCPCHPHR